MARLRHILLTPQKCEVAGDRVLWSPAKNRDPISGLPVIFWKCSTPWREANLWAMQRVTEGDVSVETVRANMTALVMYASWLEDTGTNWWDFPVKKADRCLVRFRGFVISQRDNDRLAPSTATQRMCAVINFYRWLKATGFLKSEWPLWQDRNVNIRVTNNVGFERTLTVQTTDLSIKNRRSHSEKLEDGVLPVSAIDRESILSFAYTHASWELFLMLTLGFYTGMRIGTLCNLKVETFEKATQEQMAPGLYKIAIGPGARPSVSTKFGVTGFAWITAEHREMILNYSNSPRRAARVGKAEIRNKTLVFLTKNGNPFASTSSQRSSAINVAMHSLRIKAQHQGIGALRNFHFHQTRATFATQLAVLLLPIAGVKSTLAMIKDALLHKDEATTLKYIKFVQSSPMKEAIANEFTKVFMGLFTTVERNGDE